MKIVPENVSTIAKSDTAQALDDGYQEKIIAVSKPESLKNLFDDNAITGDDADEIIVALSQLVDVSRLSPGQKVRIAFATDPAVAALDQPNADQDNADNGSADAPVKTVQRPLRPVRVSIYDNGAHQATVARADNNAFVRADEPSATPELFAETPPVETPDSSGPPTLYEAVYETALAQQMPKPLIEQLVKMFAYDVDFQSRIAPGDSLEVFHSLPDPTGTASDPEILYASLTLDGVEKRLYRFRTPTTTSSTTTTRTASRRRNSWSASRCRRASSPRRLAGAFTRCSAIAACMPASTMRRRRARRSSPPATVSSRGPASLPATAT